MTTRSQGNIGKYAKEQHFTPNDASNIPPNRRGNPVPQEFSVKAQLEAQRQRYSGYTESEMRSMLVRLGCKHPEKLVNRHDLMESLDKMTQTVS